MENEIQEIIKAWGIDLVGIADLSPAALSITGSLQGHPRRITAVLAVYVWTRARLAP